MARLRTFLGVLSVALIVAGPVVALVPVENDVQDCGVPTAFLLDGRDNAPPDPEHPNVTKCSELAGKRVGAATGVFVVSGLAAIGWALLADRLDHQARTVESAEPADAIEPSDVLRGA
ncbi:MAG: hypothetical protein ACRD0U_07320 [Acidimicrobiales bacterium]